MKIRKLVTTDLGLFSKVISKMDIKSEIGKMVFSADEGDVNGMLDKKLGIQLTLVILENYHKAEKDFIKLLADLSGQTVAEVENAPLKDLVEMIQQLTKDDSIESFLELAVISAT